jgi:hypothetical protein
MLLAAIAASSGLLVAGCSSSSSGGSSSEAPSGPKPVVTKQFAREALVKANVAGACAEQEYITCQTLDGSGSFAVMIMPKADIDATFTRLCTALAGPSSDPDKALADMKMITDRESFLVVGQTGLAFPTSVDPQAIQKVLGGEIVSMADICA